MHLIFNIHKPLGLSSHDVVAQVRKLLNTKKVGHAGTLDVEASGVLILGVGEGTKLLNHLQTHHKVYQFDVYFGVLTDTLDHTGEVLETSASPLPEWLDLNPWVGEYAQTPPAYSAVKVKGKKLYEYARNHQEIPVVNPRLLTVYSLRQTAPCVADQLGYRASFEVTSSSGLYVRQLALDIALKYQTVAHTTKIHRMVVGPFDHSTAIKLEDLEARHGIKLTDAIPAFTRYVLTDQQLADVKVGRSLQLPITDDLIQVTKDNLLWGLYQKKEDHYIPIRIFKGV